MWKINIFDDEWECWFVWLLFVGYFLFLICSGVLDDVLLGVGKEIRQTFTLNHHFNLFPTIFTISSISIIISMSLASSRTVLHCACDRTVIFITFLLSYHQVVSPTTPLTSPLLLLPSRWNTVLFTN